MRVFLVVACSLVLVAPLGAQPKKGKEPPAPLTARTILTNLQLAVDSDPYMKPMKFSEFLALARDHLAGHNLVVNVVLDEEAFREDNPELNNILDTEIKLRGLPSKTTVQLVLRQALKQIPVRAAMVIRGGRVDIVPATRTTKEYLLNQTFHADFSDRKLDAAMEELSELTGVSIVMDARAKQKAQTTVTAKFRDDVALQDAVRMLAEMAELKIVYLVTGIYITTPDHAQAMQRELKKLYEPAPMPTPVFGIPGMGGVGPGVAPDPNMGVGPNESPLAPPLPPPLKKRMEAAAQ